MLDRYWHGGTSRISPEAPVPVVHVQDIEERLGGAANVAVNVAALGAHPVLIGNVGDDEAAGIIEQLLGGYGIESRLEHIAGCSTVTKMRVMSRHQQLIRLDFEDGFTGQGIALRLDAFREACRGPARSSCPTMARVRWMTRRAHPMCARAGLSDAGRPKGDGLFPLPRRNGDHTESCRVRGGRRGLPRPRRARGTW